MIGLSKKNYALILKEGKYLAGIVSINNSCDLTEKPQYEVVHRRTIEMQQAEGIFKYICLFKVL